MTIHKRCALCAAAALLAVPLLAASSTFYQPAAALVREGGGPRAIGPHGKLFADAQVKRVARTHGAKTKPPSTPPAESAKGELPPRVPFTAAEDAAAVVPGFPDARFFADSEKDYTEALPAEPGPWLILSSGGEDGAFGAGLLSGLTAAGRRPEYSVVSGLSTGALMAPFIFAGPRYDDALRKAYTKVTAADIFEAGNSTGESFVNSWPLRDFIAKEITPELIADVAAAHRAGRRLFVVTTDLDAERSIIWNMGAIAAHGGENAHKLFTKVLLASASVPGGFPPVLVDVEANGKHFQEMHVDGGIGGQFFVAPQALMATTSDYRLPATQLYIVVNTSLEPDFKVVERFAPSILSQSVDAAVKVDTRLMLTLTYAAAKRSGIGFNVATIPKSFHAPSRGSFDSKYMNALFQTGYELGRSAAPFNSEPPPYPSGPAPASQAIQVEETGAK